MKVRPLRLPQTILPQQAAQVSFFGAKALGDHSANDPGKPTAAQMEKDTDWVCAHDLSEFKGKRPQLFESKIEPSDLCQGAVGNCWLVAAFACAAEFPDCIRAMFKTKEIADARKRGPSCWSCLQHHSGARGDRRHLGLRTFV
jgi:hypothetical protein